MLDTEKNIDNSLLIQILNYFIQRNLMSGLMCYNGRISDVIKAELDKREHIKKKSKTKIYGSK